jgi:hypothetical protein
VVVDYLLPTAIWLVRFLWHRLLVVSLAVTAQRQVIKVQAVVVAQQP